MRGRDFSAAADANIFEGKRDDGDPPEDDTPGDPGSCDEAPRSVTRLRLVGTSVSATPELSLASIVDHARGTRIASVHTINACTGDGCNRVGDNAVLMRIEPERVCIWNESDQRMEALSLNDPMNDSVNDGRSNVKASSSGASGASGASGGSGGSVASNGRANLNIEKTGENSYRVRRPEVFALLENPAQLQIPASIAFEDGRPAGIKLGRFKRGSLYEQIGLKPGDVVNRINGYDIGDMSKALEVYGKLQNADNITVDYTRGGTKKTLDYSIIP